jgi:hydroxymethylbilane synthase
MSEPIRIGTRGSELALWQATEVARRLTANGYETAIVTVKTTGDKRHDTSLAAIGGKGLFIKELEEALERNAIDIAVHSLKDVPSIIPAKFALAAFLDRADPRDVWVQPDGTPIAAMPAGSVIGTSAPRRRAQLLARYPHLKVEPIRGNVDTRVKKARSGAYDGIVLASAGLTRLGRSSDITAYFAVDEMLPAAGQGIIVIEASRDHTRAMDAARRINHPPGEIAALCERGVLQTFGERLDCYSCVAVHADVSNTDIYIRAFLSDYDATRVIRASSSGIDQESVVAAVSEELMRQGALELLGVSA